MRGIAIGSGPVLLMAIGIAAAQPPATTPPPATWPPAVSAKPDALPAAEAVAAPATPIADCNCPPAGCGGVREGPGEFAWLGAQYRFMWLKNGPQPFPLATVGPTTVVGGSDLDFGTFNAFQINGGAWLN